MDVQVDDRELKAYIARIQDDLTGGPMVDAMKQAALLVTRTARELAPVDTGRLRASILPDVAVKGNEVVGVVGSNVEYAPYMELGTGVFGKGGRHWPPGAALDVWASRHGFASGAEVAAIIGMRGGLKGREFLKKGIEQNAEAIMDLLGKTVHKIVVSK